MQRTEEEIRILNDLKLALDSAGAEYTDRDILYSPSDMPGDEEVIARYRKGTAYETARKNYDDFEALLKERSK